MSNWGIFGWPRDSVPPWRKKVVHGVPKIAFKFIPGHIDFRLVGYNVRAHSSTFLRLQWLKDDGDTADNGNDWFTDGSFAQTDATYAQITGTVSGSAVEAGGLLNIIFSDPFLRGVPKSFVSSGINFTGSGEARSGWSSQSINNNTALVAKPVNGFVITPDTGLVSGDFFLFATPYNM